MDRGKVRARADRCDMMRTAAARCLGCAHAARREVPLTRPVHGRRLTRCLGLGFRVAGPRSSLPFRRHDEAAEPAARGP